MKTMYSWRELTRRAANIIVAHKFTQQNVRDFVYFKEDIKEKFFIRDVLQQGPGMSEENITYRLISDMLKGKMPSAIFSNLNRQISSTFTKETLAVQKGTRSVRSYRNNIPVPFPGTAIRRLHHDEEDGKFHFVLFGIPLTCALGRDRSNNASLLERTIAGEYKMCTSSYMIDDAKKKMFLLLCVDIPAKQHELQEGKELICMLGTDNPIVCTTSSGEKQAGDLKAMTIGTRNEYEYRRDQIRAALHRCQVDSRYNNGGHGRTKKLQAIDRFYKLESNYNQTRMHTYSRILVDIAIKHECAIIQLVPPPKPAKEEPDTVLPSWIFCGLKDKIEYKCKLAGITLQEGKKEEKPEEKTE